MKELVLNKKVILKKGQGTSNRGKYGRLLRYIEINGQDVGAKMIKEGFAFSYRKYPHEKLDEYNQLEREARENEVGLWAKGVCEYNKDKVDNTSNISLSDEKSEIKVATLEKKIIKIKI